MKYHLSENVKPLGLRVLRFVMTRLITRNVRMGHTPALAGLVRGGAVRRM